MDYEEKYKEALERARQIQNTPYTAHWDVMKELVEDLFPELTESKNERIRKHLIGVVELYYGKTDEQEKKDCLAWLEKQGEYAKFRNKIQIGDKVTRNKDGVLVNLSQLNRVAKKQGEQKPADNAEPKFHKGDWVVYCNDDVDLITGIEENGYSINNSGYIPFVCASDVRLWTIQDAKDGDVLVSESNCGLNTWYCIFKSLDGDESMTVHCYLSRDGRFETKKELCFDKDPYSTKPATKEQRDQLEKAMANAGYTFDFDKKELKKIEGTTAWSEEDENIIKELINDFEDILGTANGIDKKTHGYSIEKLKELIDWLKSFKDRVIPQPKNEWSEEDESHIRYLIECLEHCKKGVALTITTSTAQEYINWLKSLRPQSTWKPSEEQMGALEAAVDGTCIQETLYSLYQDLEKLK